VLFYSGTVFAWLEENHPEFLLLLVEMYNRKQIEILGGGFYNPLFALIQTSDRVGQIEMLTTYIRRNFGKRPSGGWLYEFSWDSSLPPIFRNAGFSYTFLPLSRMKSMGLDIDADLAPLITEDQRKVLYILPCFDISGDNTKEGSLEKSIERIRAEYPSSQLISLMLDGNAVPSLWEESGLESPDLLFEKTFAWFQKNCLEFETVTGQSIVKTLRRGRLHYFSFCASERLLSYIHDTAHSNSEIQISAPTKKMILKDRSSRRLYDKMCYVHNLMVLLRGDKARKKSAQEDLWSAQSGDAYWHGEFGGLQRPDIRIAMYKALIDAEKATRNHGTFTQGIVMDDIDCDGAKEVLYQANDYNCYVHEIGASVFEIDSFRSRQNYIATYNKDSKKPEGAFLDFIYSFGSFNVVQDTLNTTPFTFNEREKSIQRVTFHKDFAVHEKGALHAFTFKKSFLFQKHCISVDMELMNRSQQRISFRFASLSNFQMGKTLEDSTFKLSHGHDITDITKCDPALSHRGEALLMRNRQSREGLELRSDTPFIFTLHHLSEAYRNPHIARLFGSGLGSIESDTASVFPRENFYQGTEVCIGWDFILEPDSTIPFSLSLHLTT
jgi:alpha-amylase